jgi:hypothetical protein
MKLNKIQDFAKTQDATAFSAAIEARVENGKLSMSQPSAFVAQTARHQATAAA